MRARAAVCPSCGRSWTGRDLRYCGACGARLPVPERRTPRRAARAIAQALTGAGVIAAIAVLATSVTGDRTVEELSDPHVELPETDPELGSDVLGDADAEALRRLADPARLRCEPRGCEVWRRDRASLTGAVAVADLVVVLEGNRLVALEPDTGDERWTAPVGHLRGVTSDGQQLRTTGGRGTIHASPNGDGVLLVTGVEVSLVGLDGDRIWSFPPDPEIRWESVALPDVLVLHGQQVHGSRLLAIDLATGAIEWQTAAESVQIVDPDLILVTRPDLTLRGIDPATGFTLWHRASRLGRSARTIGPWVGHHREGGLSLLDRRTGEAVATMSGYVVTPPVAVDDRWVAVMTTDPDDWPEHPSRLALVALTSDGEVLWRTPIPLTPADSCCGLLVADDGASVELATSELTYVVDVASGRVLGETHPLDPGTAADAEAGAPLVWQAEDGTVVRFTGPDGLAITRDGEHIEVRGHELSIESLDPLVVGSAEQLMGIRPVPGADPDGPA